jgi:hypothetical protein
MSHLDDIDEIFTRPVLPAHADTHHILVPMLGVYLLNQSSSCAFDGLQILQTFRDEFFAGSDEGLFRNV